MSLLKPRRHEARPVRIYDPFSASNTWVCQTCHLRLMRAVGFLVDYLHADRTIEPPWKGPIEENANAKT